MSMWVYDFVVILSPKTIDEEMLLSCSLCSKVYLEASPGVLLASLSDIQLL